MLRLGLIGDTQGRYRVDRLLAVVAARFAQVDEVWHAGDWQEQSVLDGMNALLESDGHTVDAVSTMNEALAKLGTLGSRYGVLITDIGLPDGNGWELVESARAAYPALRIGVVTGWEIRTSAKSSADFTLRKPVAARELLSLVVAAE